MSQILIIVAVCVACLVGVALTAVRMPGTWFLLGVAALYGWSTEGQAVTGGSLLLLALLAIVGEIVELLASAVAARKAGGSRRAAWGGLAGGVLGMVFLTFLVPIPLIGSMVGAIAGCFAGAAIAELSYRNHLGQSTRVGFFAALGMALGTAGKVAMALAMSAILVASTFNRPPSVSSVVPLNPASVP